MKLSEFELDVMQCFWRADECSAPEVHNAVRSVRDVAYSTVKTVIDRLERKGVLERRRQDGRTIYYRALVAPEAVQQTMLERFNRTCVRGRPTTDVELSVAQRNAEYRGTPISR